MDQDFSQSYRLSPNQIYSLNHKKSSYYSEPYQKFNKPPNRKSQYYPKQNVNTYLKSPYKTQLKETNMNQLAPRFQQRALYSQHYRTDYDTSWRANLLAAVCRSKYYNKNFEPNFIKKFSNLGIRPDPEGAPASKIEENENSLLVTDYEKVLNEDTVLYSDYGSDSEDHSQTEDLKTKQEPDEPVPNSSWSTASLITHAFNKANSNKVTVMAYAVIGAELHSITKLHTNKTEMELVKITKRSQKLTENIDKARKNLKEIALGLRSCKQEIKLKTNKIPNAHEKSNKHSSPVILAKSDLSFNIQESDRRPNKRKSIAVLEQPATEQCNESSLPNYCTIDRRHRYHKERRSKRVTCPPYFLINYMNLDGVEKSPSLE